MKRKKIRKTPAENISLSERIEETVRDLYYISETDSELFPFVGEKADDVSANELLRQLGRNDPVEERNFEDFFKRLTEYQEWFGEEETKTANRFSELKELLEKKLSEIKVFKVGRIEVDVYIVGLDENNVLAGVWTKAVET